MSKKITLVGSFVGVGKGCTFVSATCHKRKEQKVARSFAAETAGTVPRDWRVVVSFLLRAERPDVGPLALC